MYETAEFNSRQQMTRIGLGSTVANNNLWKVNYHYGELAANGVDVVDSKNTGNIAKLVTTLPNVSFTQTYRYDALERIKEAKETSTNNQTTWQQSWNYDRFGNRTAFNSSGINLTTINTTPQIDPNTNRFVSGVQYDKTGNITQDLVDNQVRNFIFNGDNKQTDVKDANGVLIGKYLYDGNGARVKKVTQSETTIFVYDGDGTLIAEYSTATPTSTPTISYTTTDHLGSPRIITDKQGNVTSRRDFLPFGEELTPDGTYRTSANKFTYGDDNIRKRFTGYEKDQETQLDFAEARYYNNKYGRFTAVDPLLASGQSANPQTFNRYVYVLNNPSILTDPSGLVVGDYYTRDMTYIGSDGKDDGRYYYAEKDWVDEKKGIIHVKNVEEFFLNGGVTDGCGYQCAGLRDPIKDRANYIAFDQFTRSVLPGAENRLKSYFDVPNYDFTPRIPFNTATDMLPKISLANTGIANPWFNYTEPKNGFQALGQKAGAFAVDVGVAWATGKAVGSASKAYGSFKGGGTNFAERLFNSKTFGKESKLFGNEKYTASRTPGIFNRPGSTFKVGWSGGKEEMGLFRPRYNTETGLGIGRKPSFFGGGAQFRVGMLSGSGNRSRYHFDIPRTFVPNSVANKAKVP